jgi:hypothetical protein
MIVGNFNASTSVRNEVTDSAIYQLLYEMQRIIDEPVDEDELASAKAFITGSFARSLESPQTIANFALNIKRYNLPDDYYSEYLKRLDAVTVEEIQQIAKSYIKPDNAHIIVVGKGSEIASKLKQFGTLTYYDNYGNAYVPKKAGIPDGLTASRVIDNYLSAIGGEANIRKVNDIKIVMKAEMQGRELEISVLSKNPDKYKQSVNMGGMEVMTMIYDGVDLMIQQMGQTAPVDEKQKLDMSYSAAIVSEIAVKDKALEMKLVGVENIEGASTYVVEVTKPSGDVTTYYYDIDSGLKLRESSVIQGPQGEMVQNTDLMDYQEVEGVKFPATIIFPMGPMKMKATTQSIEVNSGISDSEFQIQ